MACCEAQYSEVAQATCDHAMTNPPFQRLLIANRGEIALRILRTAQDMGIASVAVYSDADRNALHVRKAGRAVRLGPALPAESYLSVDRLIEAAVAMGCDCVHPGYGFLAENADFAEACAEAGIAFIGPPAEAIRVMGDKVAARKVAEAAGVPLIPGMKEDIKDSGELATAAAEIGYPVMLKAAAGGGGKGIRIVEGEEGLEEAAQLARAEARTSFGDDRIYLEKFIDRPRHVEIQVMADREGEVVHYGERECSVQRRHQKLVEESPCVAISQEIRDEMGKAACDLARSVGYVGAGTVEFLYSEGRFYFLEMNTRLQVEHPVTEMRFGVDLVREQICVAGGASVTPPTEPRGHSIEIRINAEDPQTGFPSLGTITRMNQPGGPGVRLDSSLFRGLEVTPHYDSMLAKLIVHADDRERAIARARRACRELRIVGVTTSVPVGLRVLQSEEFSSGDYDTSILTRLGTEVPEWLEEMASLAAAVSRYQGTERIEASGQSAAPEGVVSPWALADRLDRLDGRSR
jgi:acetyl-CoA carboxylase biotin carboxylase subunit